MKKRILSLLTTLVMVVGLVGVVPTVSVGAITQSDVTSKLNSYINQYNGKTATSNQMYMGSQCKGFANWVFLKIFGVYIGPYPNSANYKITNPNADTVGIIEPGNLTEESARNLLRKGSPGDYIQVQRSTARGRGPHSMILASVDDSGIWVFDCNSDGKNTIKNYHISWSAFDTANRAMSLYHAYGYDTSTPSKPTGPSLPSNIADIGEDFSAKIIHSSSGKLLTDYSSDVALYEEDKTRLSAQIWKFHRNSDGSYTIQSSYNDKVFDLDDYKDTDCTNIHLYYSGNTSNQKWYIYKLDDGSVVFQPTCSSTRVLDLADGSTNNGTTAWLYTFNNSVAQKFYIENCDDIVSFGKEQSGLITNYSSWKPIMQQDDKNVVLGREKVVNMNRTSWRLCRNDDDGSYTIYNYLNGYVLAVDGSEDVDCANVVCKQYEECSANSRKWWFLCRSDGTTYVKSACSVRALDLLDGSISDGTNVQMYSVNGTDAQTFVLYPYDAQRDKISYSIEAEKTICELDEKIKVTMLNCTYAISYKIHVIDPSGNETIIDNGCNDVYTFVGDKIGDYIIFAEVVSPVSSDMGSATSKSITINVSCTHNYTSAVTTQATCTSTGVKTYTCSVCGDSYTEIIPKTAHTYDSGKITTVATCTTDGIKTYTCTVCGATKTVTIPKTGHTIVIDKAIAPTDTQSGKTEGSHCSVCGEIIKEQEIIPKLGHDYDVSSTTPATCTSDGIITYICSTCSDTYTEVIPATGHKSVTDKAQSATCTENGKTEGSHCSVCGEIIKEQDIIPKLGHDYNVSNTTPATCTSDGIITYTCSTCGDTYTEVIPATGHIYEDIVHKATCTEQGYIEHKCSVCGDVYEDNYTDSIGHDYIEEIIQPTETEQGYTLHTCTICGDSYKDNYTDYKPTVVLIGDINKDGKISTADVGLANAHAKNTKLLNDEQFKRADINKDGKVSTADVGLINAYAKGTKKYA